MNEQLTLFEMPQRPVPGYNLVLAAFPDSRTVPQIITLGNLLRTTHALSGRVRPATHLHVSLPIPRYDGHQIGTVVEDVSRVCEAVIPTMNPFEIRFNQVMSFRRRLGNHPLVLLSDDRGSNGIIRLHELLYAEFAKPDARPSSAPKFVPHLTLLYDKKQLAPQPVAPVHWTVREIVLVLSEVGATKYHRLGHWVFGR